MSTQSHALVCLYVSSSVVSFAPHAAPPYVLGFLSSEGKLCAVSHSVEFIERKKKEECS